MADEPQTDETTQAEPWSPDIRWALPLVLAVWVWALGWLPAWSAHESADGASGYSPWLMVPAGLVGTLVGVWRARHAWPVHTHGETLREQGSLLAAVGAVASTVWLVVAGYTSPWAQTPLLLIIAAVCGVWYAMLVTAAPRHAAAQADRIFAVTDGVTVEWMREALDGADLDRVLIHESTETRAGYTATLGPDPSFRKRPSFADVEGKIDAVRTNVAIYWRERDGTVLDSTDVALERQSLDRWLLHVSTKHVLRETIEYKRRRSRSFNLPVWLGLFEDGLDMDVTLRGRNMLVVGVMGGGKSNVLNNIIARSLETKADDGRPEAVVMVCATDKLTPLVAPWLYGYMHGQTARPVINTVVGEEPDRVLDFLVRVLKLARSRNDRLLLKSKHEASPEMPGIVVIVEEVKLLTNHNTEIEFEGQYWGFSKLLAQIAPLTRSAGMTLVLATQIGLFDGLGNYGDELQRHLTVRMCLQTETYSDGTATVPKLPSGIDTRLLEDHSNYLQRGLGERSRAARGKVAKLDEGEVLPISLDLSTGGLAEPNADDIEALGRDWYDDRWHGRHHPKLVRAVEREGRAWPVYDPTRVHGSVPAGPVVSDVVPEPAEPAERPDAATQSPGGEDMGEPDSAWRPEYDDELDRLLGRPPKQPERTGIFGPGDVADLERLARQANEEADAIIAGRDAADAAAAVPSAPVDRTGILQPLRGVLGYIDTLSPRPEWIATDVLAREAFGDERPEAPTRLGRVLAAKWPALSSTNPRAVGDGRKARGFMVADLYRAAGEGA